jgi:hypothetical protein
MCPRFATSFSIWRLFYEAERVTDRSDASNVAKRVARAAFDALNVGVVTAGAIGAAAFHSWPVLALGSAAYAAMIAWDLTSGKTETRSKQRGRLRPSLDSAEAYTDAGAKTAATIVHKARAEIARVLSKTPIDVQANLTMALASVDELEERVASLAERAEYIARYLATTNIAKVRDDVNQLSHRVQSTRDAEALAQYKAAYAARLEHLNTLEELAAVRERIGAAMLNIASSLEGLPPKIVRMGALDADAMDKLGGDVQNELLRMNGEIKTMEDTLRSLGEIGTTPQ